MSAIEHQYLSVLHEIVNHGTDKSDRTGTGTKSIFGYQIIHDMKSGFPLLTTKKMAWKSIVTELLWFLKGDTNIKYLVDNGCNVWNGDAYKNYLERYNSEDGEGLFTQEEFIEYIKNKDKPDPIIGELGPIYGAQWREWYAKTLIKTTLKDPLSGNDTYVEGSKIIDQIANLINDLKTNPDSRRLMVNAWNVGELDQMVLPPCHYSFQVYTRELTEEERIQWVIKNTDVELENVAITEIAYNDSTPKRAISLMWNQRSVDTFLGLPFNIASYALLLEIIAKIVNMIPDELIGSLGDVHLYNNHIEQAKEQLTREPLELPTLNINSGNENWHLLEIDEIINSLDTDITFKLINYQSHPAIKAPLSN